MNFSQIFSDLKDAFPYFRCKAVFIKETGNMQNLAKTNGKVSRLTYQDITYISSH